MLVRFGKADKEKSMLLVSYRICPFKRALRGGDDWVCVYLLVKTGSVTDTSNP